MNNQEGWYKVGVNCIFHTFFGHEEEVKGYVRRIERELKLQFGDDVEVKMHWLLKDGEDVNVGEPNGTSDVEDVGGNVQ